MPRELVINNDIIIEWNWDRNSLDPFKITCGSSKKAWWVCGYSHEWFACINDRCNGAGCPYCSGRLCEEKDSVFRVDWLMREWHPDNKWSPKTTSLSSDRKVKWICKVGHVWHTRVPDRLRKNSQCPFCSGSRASPENNLRVAHSKLLSEWDFDKNKLGPEHYLPQSNYIANWTCKYGHYWRAAISDRVRRETGCPFCVKRVSNVASKWLDELGILSENREVRITTCDGNKYEVDGFDPETNTIYEFYGDYWHGNIKTLNPCEINKRNGTSFGDLYKKTIKRENSLKNTGYNVVSIWESEYKGV